MLIRNLLLTLFCFLALSLAAQRADESIVNIPSPNAATFGLFGDIPVNQFTGTPNIEIPLTEINVGGLKVPITLNYHPSAVRVHSHPGWVGLGWNLNAGGVITRVANGQLDEFKGGSYMNGVELGFYSSYANLAGTDAEWTTTARMQKYASDYTFKKTSYEAMPDEFSFNFLNYSGKFFRTHDGQWKVISDQEIKIEFDPTDGVGFITQEGLPTNLLSRIKAVNSIDQVWTHRYFNKFTLVTPDGARFEFGGANAIEYSMAYVQQLQSGPVPVSWFLTKITTPLGDEISFNYQPGDIITSMTSQIGYNSMNRDVSHTMFDPAELCGSFQTLTKSNYDGTITYPVYLNYISYPQGSVSFYITPTTELRWPSDESLDFDMSNAYQSRAIPPVYFEPKGLAPHNYPGFGIQRNWYKLDEITVSNSLLTASSTVKRINFTYTSDATKRLHLNSLQIKDTFGKIDPPYIFSYCPLNMPSYSAIESNDHWDFYNGLDPSKFNLGSGTVDDRASRFFSFREPDESGVYQKAEILEQIQYPTGGKTRFEYEPHTYSKVVDRANSSFQLLNKTNTTAGGLRIKQILNYENSGDTKPTTIKEYSYLNSFSLGADLSLLSSSGILGSYPQYYWKDYRIKDIGGGLFTYTTFSSGAVRPYGFNSSGSYIGYSEVTEISKKEDGTTSGYIKYKFTNVDNDIWGNAHPDEPGYSLDPSRSVYMPFTSNEGQRGKIVSQEYFSSTNSLVRATKYKYNLVSNGYVRRVFQEPFITCTGGGCPSGISHCFQILL